MGGWVCLLYSTVYWSLLHLTFSGVFFTRPSTGVFFTWPSLESSLLDPLLESSSLDLLWSLLHLTLSRVFFTRLSTGVFFTWPSLESSSLNLLWSLLYSTLYWSLLVWVSLSLGYLQLTDSQSVSQSVILCYRLSWFSPGEYRISIFINVTTTSFQIFTYLSFIIICQSQSALLTPAVDTASLNNLRMSHLEYGNTD
jgi:hypothetical protein